MTVSSNSELLRRGYEAWNDGDLETWLERLHPEIRIQTSGVFPDLANEYVGHERARKFWRQMREPWEWFSIDIPAWVYMIIFLAGDWAIASIRFRARGADSGVEVDMRFGMAMRVQDGTAIELVNRRNFDEARTAVRQRSSGRSTPRART